MSNKPSISDVAQAANVSIATVSRVMNNHAIVRKETREKVYKAMSEVGYDYTPEFPASQENHNSKIILVLLPNLENPFYSDIINGIHSSALRQDYICVLHILKEQKEYSLPALTSLIENINACGLILLAPISDPQILEHLSTIIPLVQCTEFTDSSNLSFVSIDDYSATKNILEFILSKNKKRIALINGPLQFKYARLRDKAYRDALSEAGLPIDPSIIINVSEMDYNYNISMAMQLLNTDHLPDAIFAASDVFAVAAMKAAKRLGLSVPKDIGIVGFDNSFIASMCEPPLTTMNQPKKQMGFLACETLISQINNPTAAKKQMLLETELIIRESI